MDARTVPLGDRGRVRDRPAQKPHRQDAEEDAESLGAVG